MKNCISIILTAAMTLTLTACTAAPDPAPLATPTPEPTAAPAAPTSEPTAAPAAPTPAPAAADFYTLKSYNGSFDDGTAYYEFTQRLGCALLLKTDYAAAVQSVCCAVPGCGHDTDACPAYFPGGGPAIIGWSRRGTPCMSGTSHISMTTRAGTTTGRKNWQAASGIGNPLIL